MLVDVMVSQFVLWESAWKSLVAVRGETSVLPMVYWSLDERSVGLMAARTVEQKAVVLGLMWAACSAVLSEKQKVGWRAVC